MNLHDLFVVRIRKQFSEKTPEELKEKIPERYHPMFSALWNEFQSLEEMIDQENFYSAYFVAKNYEKPYITFFYDPGRKESLQTIILEEFFEKLLVAQNVYNTRGHNIIILLDKLFTSNISFKKCENTQDAPVICDMNKKDDDIFINVSSDNIISWETWKTTNKPNEDNIQFEYNPEFFKNKQK